MRVTNGIPLGSSLLLPVHTVICVQTLKGCSVKPLLLIWGEYDRAVAMLAWHFEQVTSAIRNNEFNNASSATICMAMSLLPEMVGDLLG
jgi:hypothetical protein